MVRIKTNNLSNNEKAELLGFPGHEIDFKTIPDIPHESYKKAWDLVDKKIKINMEKARNVCRERLREIRTFDLTDKIYIEKHSKGDDLTSVKEKQIYLRNVTIDPRIEKAINIDDLEKIIKELKYKLKEN